jgi:hypothetical protein
VAALLSVWSCQPQELPCEARGEKFFSCVQLGEDGTKNVKARMELPADLVHTTAGGELMVSSRPKLKVQARSLSNGESLSALCGQVAGVNVLDEDYPATLFPSCTGTLVPELEEEEPCDLNLDPAPRSGTSHFDFPREGWECAEGRCAQEFEIHFERAETSMAESFKWHIRGEVYGRVCTEGDVFGEHYQLGTVYVSSIEFE